MTSAYSLLLLALAAAGCAGPVETHGATTVRGRAGRKLVAAFPSGHDTARLPLASGELLADVVEVTNDAQERAIVAVVEWQNRSDEALHVAVADLMLHYAADRHAAKLPLDVEMPPLRPRTRQRTPLRFELDAPPRAGVYDLQVRRVAPAAGAMTLRVRVPGPIPR